MRFEDPKSARSSTKTIAERGDFYPSFFHPGLLHLRKPDDRVAMARIHNTFPKPVPCFWNKGGGDLCFKDSRSIAQPELDSDSRVMYEGEYNHEKGGER